MEVVIRVRLLPVKLVDRLGVFLINVLEANEAANDGCFFVFHQSVVACIMRPRVGLPDVQLFQQTRGGAVDKLTSVVGMKAANHEGKPRRQRFQHRQRPEFGDVRSGGPDDAIDALA
jgi:hypothetical protein